MSIGGGVPRDHVRPTSANAPNTLGDHRGVFSAMNILNPLPGFRYMWERFKGPKGDGSILNRENYGYTRVLSTDPDGKGMRSAIQRGETPVNLGGSPGTEITFGDVMAMRVPITRYAEIQEEKRQLARAAANAVEAAHRDRGETLKAAIGPSAGPGDLYYARSDHRVTDEE